MRLRIDRDELGGKLATDLELEVLSGEANSVSNAIFLQSVTHVVVLGLFFCSTEPQIL